jgi:uncharacterized protein YndB with AHSA1/START domain
MNDKIEKEIVVAAPLERAWRAITDHNEFGTWFGVKLETAFVVGEVTEGKITAPGFEHMIWKSTTTVLDAASRFAFTWNPYDYEPYDQEDVRESAAPPLMQVEFQLQPVPDGTRILISEAGFMSLPDDERREAMWQSCASGWTEQAANLSAYFEP